MKAYVIFLCLDIILILNMAIALWLNENTCLLFVTFFACLLQTIEIIREEKRSRCK